MKEKEGVGNGERRQYERVEITTNLIRIVGISTLVLFVDTDTSKRQRTFTPILLTSFNKMVVFCIF